MTRTLNTHALESALEKFYTVAQAAKLLGRNAQTIRKHCQHGRIDAARVGASGYLIPEAEVMRLAGTWGERFPRGRVRTSPQGRRHNRAAGGER